MSFTDTFNMPASYTDRNSPYFQNDEHSAKGAPVVGYHDSPSNVVLGSNMHIPYHHNEFSNTPQQTQYYLQETSRPFSRRETFPQILSRYGSSEPQYYNSQGNNNSLNNRQNSCTLHSFGNRPNISQHNYDQSPMTDTHVPNNVRNYDNTYTYNDLKTDVIKAQYSDRTYPNYASSCFPMDAQSSVKVESNYIPHLQTCENDRITKQYSHQTNTKLNTETSEAYAYSPQNNSRRSHSMNYGIIKSEETEDVEIQKDIKIEDSSFEDMGVDAPELVHVFEKNTSLNTKSQTNKFKKEKMHQCGICTKKFPRPSSLQTHMYTHTGEKPFACNENNCNKRFSVMSNLRRHIRVHKSRNKKLQVEQSKYDMHSQIVKDLISQNLYSN